MEKINTLIIKPYEPINDALLMEMVSKNLYFPYSAKMSVQSAIIYYGWFRIGFFLLAITAPLVAICQIVGFGVCSALSASLFLVSIALVAAYGYIIPLYLTVTDHNLQKTRITNEFRNIQERFIIPKRNCFWLATVKAKDQKEKIVGSVLVEPYDTHKDYANIVRSKEITGDIAELRRLSVHEDYRRLGIAEKLVSELKEFSKKCGYQAIMISCPSNHSVALAAYKKFGFLPLKRIPVLIGHIPYLFNINVNRL